MSVKKISGNISEEEKRDTVVAIPGMEHSLGLMFKYCDKCYERCSPKHLYFQEWSLEQWRKWFRECQECIDVTIRFGHQDLKPRLFKAFGVRHVPEYTRRQLKHLERCKEMMPSDFREIEPEIIKIREIIKNGDPVRVIYDRHFLYKDAIYKFDRDDYSSEEMTLQILDLEDKERRKFERLKRKFELSQQMEKTPRRGAIPEEVRIAVWRRDSGKCAKCGSRKNLEYDHIIPVSKGGGNTVRNIELLCEECNRKKRDNIE